MRYAVLFVALPLVGQSIPAASIYQGALGQGIVYIQPAAGAAIVNDKSATNIKNVLLDLAGQTAVQGALATLTGVIKATKPITAGLLFGDGFVEVGKKLLSQTAPQGTAALSPVLMMNGTMSPGDEATIYASQFQAVTPKQFRAQKATVNPVTLTIKGCPVTFTPQGTQLVQLAAGSRIKNFIPVDVIVGFPQ